MTIEIRTKVKYLRRKLESLDRDIEDLKKEINKTQYIINTYEEYKELLKEELLNLINSL